MEGYTQVRLVCRGAHVYKVPPVMAAKGFMCANWPPENCIFTGRMKVTTTGEKLTLIFEDDLSGQPFTEVPIEYINGEAQVERAADSSRYFVVKLKNGANTVFCGIGFDRREDAFDFTVQLRDHGSFIQRQGTPDAATKQLLNDDLIKGVRQQQGQKIGLSFGTPKKPQSQAPRPAPAGFAPPPSWSK